MVIKAKKIGCLTLIGCVIASILLYRFTAKERVYYIQERDFYIRISVVPNDDYGYIYFGKDSLSVLKEKDYFKIHKALDNIIVSMFLKTDGDTIYYIPLSKPREMKQTDFTFVEKERFDSTVFDSGGKTPYTNIIKPEYIKTITLYDFNTDLYVSQDTTRFMERLKPLNK